MVISNELNNKTLVVVQLNGGNDFMNTVVPYGNGLYRDFRPIVGVDQEHITPIDDYIGFNNDVAPINDLYNKGQVASFKGLDILIPVGHILEVWIYGIHAYLKPSLMKDGWVKLSVILIQERKIL